jgi:hypothetical protein
VMLRTPATETLETTTSRTSIPPSHCGATGYRAHRQPSENTTV